MRYYLWTCPGCRRTYRIPRLSSPDLGCSAACERIVERQAEEIRRYG